MYNGIGLATPRGSGTNGYVARNLATVYKAKEKGFKAPSEVATPTLKKPNTEIIEHDRKRKVEVKCVEFQQMLEDQGYSHEEITKRVTKYRNSLLGEKNTTELRDENGRIIVKDTHEIAEAQQRKNDKLREAFGISEYFVDGSSFDSERRTKEAAAKAALEATKKYTWIPSPPSSGDEVEKQEPLPESSPKSKKRSKKSSSPSEETKKKKKKKHKRRSRSTTTKEEKSHRRDKKSKHSEVKEKKKSKTSSPARSKSKKSKKDRSASEESHHKKKKASPTKSVRRHESKESKYKEEKKRKQKDVSPKSERSYRRKRELSPTENRRKRDLSPAEERRKRDLSPAEERRKRDVSPLETRSKKRDISPVENRSRKRELSLGEERNRTRYRSSSVEKKQRKYDKDDYKKGSPSRRPKSRRSISVDKVEIRRSPVKRRRSPSIDYNDRKRRRRSVSITRKDSYRNKYEKKSKLTESSEESDRYLSDEKNSKKVKSKLVVRRRTSDVKEKRRNYEYDQYSSDEAKKSKYSNRRKDKYEEDRYDEKKKPKSSYFDKSKKNSSRIDEIEKKISCRYSVESSEEEGYNSPKKNEDLKLKKNDKLKDLNSLEKRKPVEEAKKLDTKEVSRKNDSQIAENGVVKNDKVNRDGSTSSSLSYSPMEKYPHRYLDILGDMPRKTSKTVVENVQKLNSTADSQNVTKKDDRLKRETEFLNKFKSGIAEKVNSEKISPKKLPVEESKLQSVTDTLPISLKDVPLPPEAPASKVSTSSSDSVNKKEEKKSEVNVSNKVCGVNGNEKIKESKNTSLNARITEKLLLLKKTLQKQKRDSDSSSSADESKSPGKQSRSDSVSSSSSDSSRSSRSSSSSSSSSDSDRRPSRSSRRSRRSRSGSDESSDSENSRSYSSSDSSRSRSRSDSPKRNRKRHRKSRSGSDSRSDSDSYTSRTSRSRSISIPRRKGSPSFLERRRITSARKRPVPYDRSWASGSGSNSSSTSSSPSSSPVSRNSKKSWTTMKRRSSSFSSPSPLVRSPVPWVTPPIEFDE